MSATNCGKRKPPLPGKRSDLAFPELSLAAVLISSAFAFNGNQARQAPSQSPGNRLAVQNVPFMARALGLGATLTTLHLVFEKEAEAALGLPPNVHSYALLPIGYPMGRFGPVRRVPLADVVYEDRWGQPYSV
jgi:nitroreductase